MSLSFLKAPKRCSCLEKLPWMEHSQQLTADKTSVSGNVMYPFDLKSAGATHAEMLALKNNDAGECVCWL